MSINNCLISSQYTPWSTVPPEFNLPRPDSQQAIGYDEISNSIYIIGGSLNEQSMIQYTLNVSNENALQMMNDIGKNYFNRSLKFVSQSYTQHNGILYLISDDEATGKIYQFILSTKMINYSYASSEHHVTESCLTSLTLNNNDYLIIIGGLNSGLQSNSTQAFDITNNLWITTNEPSLNTRRSQFSCNAVGHAIYAMGGRDITGAVLPTIEVLNVSQGMNNIATYSYNYMEPYLPFSLRQHRSVVYGSQIIIIGGRRDPASLKNIQIIVIDTLGHSVYIDGDCDYDCTVQPVIFVYPYFYAFGGLSGEYVITGQYHKIMLSLYNIYKDNYGF